MTDPSIYPLISTSGQTLVDRVTAAKHTLSGAGLAKSVCKATTEEPIAPKRKHLEDLVNYTNEPNVSIPQMANHLIDRSQNGNWIVVYKALISVHHLMCYGNERFTQYLATNNCAFHLSNFVDKSTTAGYDMSPFVKRYANYLNEKAITYRHMGFDFCKVKRGKDGVLRTMNPDKLVKTLPVLQNQLDALLSFNCSPGDITNAIINNCFILLFRDLVRLFACYNDGNMNLLESYWTMNKKQCREALDLYTQFLIRMDRVSEFLKSAEAAGIDKSDIPDITKIPTSLLESMEQHLQYMEGTKKDKKQPSLPDKGSGPPTDLNDMVSAMGYCYAGSSPKVSYERAILNLSEREKREALELEALKLNEYKIGLDPNASTHFTIINNNYKRSLNSNQINRSSCCANLNNIGAKEESASKTGPTFDGTDHYTKPTRPPSPSPFGATPQKADIPEKKVIDIFDSLMMMSPEDTTTNKQQPKNDWQNDFGSANAFTPFSVPTSSNNAFDSIFNPSPQRASAPLTNDGDKEGETLHPFTTSGYDHTLKPTMNGGGGGLITPQSAHPNYGSASPIDLFNGPAGFSGAQPIQSTSATSSVPGTIIKGDLDSSLANIAASLNIQSHDQAIKKTTHQWTTSASPSRNTLTSGNNAGWSNMKQPALITAPRSAINKMPTLAPGGNSPFLGVNNTNAQNNASWATFSSSQPNPPTFGASPFAANPFQSGPSSNLLTPTTMGSTSPATPQPPPFSNMTNANFGGGPGKNPFLSPSTTNPTPANIDPAPKAFAGSTLSAGNKGTELFKSLDNLNVWNGFSSGNKEFVGKTTNGTHNLAPPSSSGWPSGFGASLTPGSISGAGVKNQPFFASQNNLNSLGIGGGGQVNHNDLDPFGAL